MIDFASLLKNMDKMNEITKETVEQARAKEPKRICFATTHASALKHSAHGSYAGSINVPFGGGLKNIFPHTLFPNTRDQYHEDSYWLGIESEELFEEIDAWVKSQGDRVFLRDCLYASIAMSHNFTDDGERTNIGELEYRAKQNHDMGAVEALAEHCTNTIMDIPLYSKADMVCAIPPRPSKGFDLPSLAVSIVSEKVGKEDISEHFSFGAEKRSVKSETLDEKWDAWDDAMITFNGDLTDKKIILIDDKYQSGTTIQYIAMKLQEAGAHHVLGLSMVKTMRDTDNQ